MILPCQKPLFDIPDGVTYLNCAYLSPLLNSVHEAGARGLARKRHPWTIVRADFHNETEAVRALFAGLIGARADDIAIVPATSYGIAVAAANLPIERGRNIVLLADQHSSNFHQWRVRSERHGAELHVVPRPADGDWTAAAPETRPYRRSFHAGRGLGDPLLVVSDGAPGVIKAIEVCFPRSTRQRCLAHRMRNLAATVPEDLWPEFKARAIAAYQAPSRKIARELADGVVADDGTELANATACFMDDFEACIAHLRLPITHRRATRTTDLLERRFVEERRRLKIIPNAFGEKTVLKLMFGAMTRAAERWRSIRITEFERRQMAALRQELDHDYQAAVGLDTTRSKPAAATQIPSSSRTLTSVKISLLVFGL